MMPWEEIHSRWSSETLLPNIERYSDVLDAIDEALFRAQDIEPSPTDVVKLADILRIKDLTGKLDSETVYRPPTVVVRVPNTVRLAIGLLQRERWLTAARVEGFTIDTPGAVQLPWWDVLLKRKVRPTEAELVDIARFLVTPALAEPGVKCCNYQEPLSVILRLLEKQVNPPALGELRKILVEAVRRTRSNLDEILQEHARSKTKARTATFDKWIARMERIVG